VVAQYKKHIKCLEDSGWFASEYAKDKDDMPELPSYSCMLTLEESIKICMFSKTHNTILPDAMKIHFHHMIRFILGPNMILIWDEQTLHGGAKSTPSPTDPFETLKHLRLFFYTHPNVERNPNIKGRKNARHNNGLNDSVAQEWGENLYRDEFKKKSCPHIHDYPSQCDKCQEGSEVVIDLTVIGSHQYNQPSQVILGDLKRDGWVVCRGVNIDTKTHKAIKNMAFEGHSLETPHGHWHSIKSESNTHCMKYDHNTIIPPEWEMGDLKRLLEQIKSRIISKRCGENYVIERQNLLMNLGEMPYDQLLHTDYAPRKTNL